MKAYADLNPYYGDIHNNGAVVTVHAHWVDSPH